MAEEGRAVSVYGLPADVDHERLRDKLLIHFLRQSNGGGEVKSVSLIGRTPLRALVTFEESRVVQSVLRHHPHVLQLDGIKYELSLSLPNQEPLSLNKVILSMTVTVDCSQLPQGADTLNALQSEFPDLRMERDFLRPTCTLQGSYSDFQTAFPYMQTLFAHHISQAKNQNFIGDNGHGHKVREDPAGAKKWDGFTSQSPAIHAGDFSFRPREDLGQENYRLQDNNEALTGRSTQSRRGKIEEGAECRTDEDDLEDLSIIMDADVFAYLQNIKEYNRILQHHGVQVVHVTSEGVTTVYLQSSKSEVKQNIKQAHKELRQLYQQQEAFLRKDQVKRSALYMADGLNTTLKQVQLLLPNVLLSFDQDNIYIVGEKSEVSQAKQMLLIGVEKDLMSLTEIPPSSSSFPSASPEPLEREQQVMGAPQTLVPPKLIGSSTERKGEIGNTKEYKLAARFKREEIGGDIRSLTTKMDMLKLAQSSQSTTPPTRPLFGTTGELSIELPREGTEAFRMTEPSCTGQDILFKNQDPLSLNTFGGTTFSTSKAKPSTSAGLTSTLGTGVMASVSTNVNSLSASNTKVKTAAPSSTSKSSLRRSNSFSGQPREQVKNNQVKAEPTINANSHKRARSNSISGGRPSKDCPVTVVEAELTVSGLMWTYIKDAYRSQVQAMECDLQMSEKRPGKSHISVTLKGTDSAKVEESHRELQNLVAIVASDFGFYELCLNELGVDQKDELFLACCSSLRTHISKVSSYTTKRHLVLIGPKFLCSQVSDIFKDVFSGQKSHSSFLLKLKTLQECVEQGASKAFLSIRSTRADHSKSDQSLKEFSFQDTSQVVQSNGSLKSDGHLTKKKSDTLEKLEHSISTEDKLSKANTLSQLANAKEDTQSDKPSSLPLEAKKKQDTSKILKQTNLLSSITSEQCVCGAIGANVKRTSCGVILCSDCKLLHSHCRVCGKEEVYAQNMIQGQSIESKNTEQDNQAQEQYSGQEDIKEHKGIQGTMTCVEMPLSLSGYNKYTMAKIKYSIPDGIQGDKDPHPGSPFEGGQFVAYLPLDPKGRSLLPSLKKAFDQGLTFVISTKKANGGDAKVSWGKIPHKTSMEGGRGRNGYPDSTYLVLLSEALVAHGIEGAPGS